MSASGEVRVYNKNLFFDLVQDGMNSSNGPARSTSFKSNVTSRSEQLRIDKENRRKEMNDRLKAEAAKRKAIIEKNMVKEEQRKNKEFEERYNELFDEREKWLAGHLQPMLQHYKGSKKQKMEALYRAWNREVFEKGSDRIADKLAEMSEDEITKRRAERFQKFLSATNGKSGGLFLDIVLDDYDPFEWQKDQLKYKATVEADPMKKDLIKQREEALSGDSMGMGSMFKSSHAEDGSRYTLDSTYVGKTLGGEVTGKVTLPVKQWCRLDGTPYFDRSAAMEGVTKDNAAQKSRINLDDFNFPQGAEVVKQEVQGLHGKGKKVFANWKPAVSLVAQHRE